MSLEDESALGIINSMAIEASIREDGEDPGEIRVVRRLLRSDHGDRTEENEGGHGNHRQGQGRSSPGPV